MQPLTIGLSSAEAAARLSQHGPNELPEPAPVPLWRRFLDQFSGPLILILLVALLFDAGFWLFEGARGWPVEAAAIALILVFNAALGVYQERRSEAALTRLKALAAAHAWVLRDAQLVQVPSRAIVPGDVVRIDTGSRIPADGVVIDPQDVLVDESILTGESIPVEKAQGDPASSGTLIVRGRTLVDVRRTGTASNMGRLAAMLSGITPVPTPLERRIDRLGRQIARWVLMLAATLAVLGIVAEGIGRAADVVIFAVALAVAAVPEGLPAILTVALALGVERMARAKAVVRRLAAVEALGSVTVIATDKTGTLTENRMDVHSLDSLDADRALLAIVLVNDGDLASGSGDPLELGLLRYAASRGLDIAAVRRSWPVLARRAFDSRVKFSRVTVRDGAGVISFIKGAPEVIIGRCAGSDEERASWREKADAYAQEGFRVLAVAQGDGDREDQLAMLALVLFWDPPRPEVPGAVRRALDAGIRVIMITGDHPATALAVAREIGLPGKRVVTGLDLDECSDATRAALLNDVNVFARVRPEQKLEIVRALQAGHAIVAMTGDGVNDAAALKQADVGVAMGQRGSDVSREVADLVLLDDNFASIVRAVEEGRGIYENVQKFLRFLFSTNLSEILLIASGAVLAFALDLRDPVGALMVPLTAVQILWINLTTDGLPALALALDRTPGTMLAPPRPAESPLLDAPSRRFVVIVGVMKATIALAMLGVIPLLGHTALETRSTVFHFMAIGQLLLTYAARHTETRPLPNVYLHAAVAAGIVLQVTAGSLPVTARLLDVTPLSPVLWLFVGATAVAALAGSEAVARFAHRPRAGASRASGPDTR